MVSVKSIKNEKFFKDMENVNKKFNEALKNLAESKKIITILNDQLMVKEEKVKKLIGKKVNLLKEKNFAEEDLSSLQ